MFDGGRPLPGGFGISKSEVLKDVVELEFEAELSDWEGEFEGEERWEVLLRDR